MERAVVRARAWLVYQRIREGLPIGELVAATPWVVYAHDRRGRRLLHVAAGCSLRLLAEVCEALSTARAGEAP